MPQWTEDQLAHIADLLLAAAHADSETVSAETDAARSILAKLSGSSLSAALSARLDGFDAKSFDLGAAAKSLGALDAEHRKELLAMIAQITESDDVHDLDESEFIVRVARAIGASPADYKGLTIELTPSGPPPLLPKS